MDISAMSLGAGLAVGLAGAGVAMGQGRLAGTSIEMMGKSPLLVLVQGMEKDILSRLR